MTWKADVLECVHNLCKKKSSVNFTLDEMYAYVDLLASKHPNNNFVEEKIRQQLQYLRDEGHISFEDNYGSYKLNAKY